MEFVGSRPTAGNLRHVLPQVPEEPPGVLSPKTVLKLSWGQFGKLPVYRRLTEWLLSMPVQARK